MKACFRHRLGFVHALALALIPNLANGDAENGALNSLQGVRDTSLITSSSFEMILYPSLEVLDTTATNKVEHAIKTALLLSTSVTTNFLGAEEVDVDLERVEFVERFEPLNPLSNFYLTTPATLLEFTVDVCIIVQDDDESSLPSKFALDNLIVRTFSQPSSKSSFIVTLGLARDPMLNDVLDIEIDLVEKASDLTTKAGGPRLSTIDIVLIIGSIVIFLGIIGVICYYHNTRSDAERDLHLVPSRNAKPKSTPGAAEDAAIETDISKESKTNDSPDSSPREANEDLQDQINRDFEPGTITLTENIVEGSSLESSVDGHSATGLPTTESPEMLYASSSSSVSVSSKAGSSAYNASSSSSESTSSGSSSPSSSASFGSSKGSSKDRSTPRKENLSHIGNELLGATQPQYDDGSVLSSNSANDLAARLMSLSTISAYDLNSRFNLFSSSSSAPPILEEMERNASAKAKTRDDKSVLSAHSASSESWESNHQVKSHASSRRRGKKQSWSSSIMVETAQYFHQNWLESKRKALEDIEEGSVEDVFQIDVDRKVSTDESFGKTSTTSSSVTNWMKSIRVVGSGSETQSSMEHSSIEPRSYAKDSSSVDLSLEQSLAGSLVGV